MAIGTNIKRRRTELRMSQQELADAMGYKTRSTIAKIESGENDVSQKKLRKLANALDTTAEALISEYAPVSGPQEEPAALPARGKHKHVAVVLAGGKTGKNMQSIPSQFINVQGKPIIIYSLEAYQNHPSVDDLYIVCVKGWESIVSDYAAQFGITKLKGIIPAGNSGVASLKNAVDHIRKRYAPEDYVIVQEATRPMVKAETISKLLQACRERGSATICHAMKEYVQFMVTDGKASYLDRNTMIALQSPEAHRLSLLCQVFDSADQKLIASESCCTMLLYNMGYDINFVESSINNIKIAREEDIASFQALIKDGH